MQLYTLECTACESPTHRRTNARWLAQAADWVQGFALGARGHLCDTPACQITVRPPHWVSRHRTVLAPRFAICLLAPDLGV